MSTKTLRKRIALIAASALTAGVLSVVAAPAANAAAGDGNFDASALNVGLVGAITPALGNPTNATTRTAVLLSTGELKLSTTGVAAIVVSSGAYISNVTGTTVTLANINGSQNCVDMVHVDNIATIKPRGAAGTTFTVTGYDDTCSAPGAVGDIITVTIAATNVAGVASAADSSVRWDSDSAGDAPSAAADITNSSTSTGNQLYLRMNVADAYG